MATCPRISKRMLYKLVKIREEDKRKKIEKKMRDKMLTKKINKKRRIKEMRNEFMEEKEEEKDEKKDELKTEELEVSYDENQYLRFDESIDEIIGKMLIVYYPYYFRKSSGISELDFSGIEEPNVLICSDVSDFENIYYTVKIIITNGRILKDKWYEIPETVEYMIMIGNDGDDNKIFRNNRNKFDYLEILYQCSSTEPEKSIEIINQLIEEGIRNEENIAGRTVLHYMLYAEMYDKMIEMIERGEFGDDMFNKKFKIGTHFITDICDKLHNYKTIRLANIVIDRMSIEALNYMDKRVIIFRSLMVFENIEIIMRVLPKITNMKILTSCDNICMYVKDRQIVEMIYGAIQRRIGELRG